MSPTAPSDGTVRLHPLTMVPEDGGVMVGRPDTGSYALFPEAGAELVRQLSTGVPMAAAVGWYERTSESLLDVDDFVATLGDFGFLREGDEDPAPAKPVRWRRLGLVVFCRPAVALYLAIVVAALVAMSRQPWLRPSYRNLFFTSHLSLIPVVLMAIGMVFVLLHEWCHMLAGRRLGLPSKLGIGRRLYFLVAETRLDALLSVPRRQRYLPFLAGTLADTVVIAALTLLAAGLRDLGVPAWCSGLCLAVAFTAVLRVIWQFQFYLETDLYYVIATALRCTHLQAAARFCIKAQVRRLLRRPAQPSDPDWSSRDRAAARWYAPVLVAGYGFALGNLAWAGIPAFVRFWSTAAHELTGPRATAASVTDALILTILALAQLGLLTYVTVRDWRAKRRAISPQGDSS